MTAILHFSSWTTEKELLAAIETQLPTQKPGLLIRIWNLERNVLDFDSDERDIKLVKNAESEPIRCLLLHNTLF